MEILVRQPLLLWAISQLRLSFDFLHLRIEVVSRANTLGQAAY